MRINSINLSRRQILGLSVAAANLGLIGATWPMGRLEAAEPADNGLHIQPWFHQGFLNLQDDLDEASNQGKSLVVFWEQRGCPYCAELHRVNLAIKDIVDYIKQNYLVIQLDIMGSRGKNVIVGVNQTPHLLASLRSSITCPSKSVTSRDPAAIKADKRIIRADCIAAYSYSRCEGPAPYSAQWAK